MTTPLSQGSLLEQIHSQVDETIWLRSIDLFESSKIGKLQDHGSLKTAVVEDMEGKYEVRIKLHPSIKRIQWMECSCRYYRVKKKYCEHLAALILSLEDQHDLSTIKSVPMIRKKTSPTDESGTVSLINHLLEKDALKKIGLVGTGPLLRVRYADIKNLSKTKDVHVDEAGELLSNLKRSHFQYIDSTLKEMELGKREAFFAYHAQTKGETELKLVRSVVIHDAKSNDVFRLVEGKEQKSNCKLLCFGINEKDVHLGQKYCFIKKQGFFRLKPEPPRSKTDLLKTPDNMIRFKDDDIVRFLHFELPKFSEQYPVAINDNVFKMHPLESLESINPIQVQKEEKGWFFLDPEYQTTGGSQVKISEILSKIQNKKTKYVKVNGTWIEVPLWMQETNMKVDRKTKQLKANLLDLFHLESESDANSLDPELILQNASTLQEKKELFEEELRTLKKGGMELRPYQKSGFIWLRQIKELGLSSLLADEMGLGKTHQAMALLRSLLDSTINPSFLVICPTTVMDHWIDKIEGFAPELNAVKYHGTLRKTASINSTTVVTSYGVLVRDIEYLTQKKWDVVVLDEAQAIKNDKTSTFQAAQKLRASMKLCLSGTPLENNLWELYTLVDFLIPNYLGSKKLFKTYYVLPIEQKDQRTEKKLQKLLQPIKMRRTKAQVVQDLPDKIEDLKHCQLSKHQIGLYKEILQLKAKPVLDDLQKPGGRSSFIHIFAIISLLKQVCDHPYLIMKTEESKKLESGKFDLLKELLSESLDSDHKVVIYSQYLNMLELIGEHLEANNIQYCKLTGKSKNRGKIVEEFQTNPETKVFLSSLLAGGIGIDLTAASVVIHYDRWWNAAKENQATDRVHRIGQNKNVLVYKLITRGTLEEKIHKIIQKKQTIFDQFVSQDEDVFKSLSKDELIEILS